MTLTGPFIDDVAPPASKARWFAWLSLTPTLGVAIGYKLGDLTQYMSWRVLFYIEAGVAVPVVLFCLLAPAVRLRGKLTQVQPEGELAHSRLVQSPLEMFSKGFSAGLIYACMAQPSIATQYCLSFA